MYSCTCSEYVELHEGVPELVTNNKLYTPPVTPIMMDALQQQTAALKKTLSFMMSSFWPLALVAIIIHCLDFPTAVNAEFAFVRPNLSVSCASSSHQPCLTFNEYAQQVEQYFVNDTTFLFLPGTHELDVQLYLEDLSNVSLVPLHEGIKDVQLSITPSANITWTNSENIEIDGFVFILRGEFSILPESEFFSAVMELVFQGTTAFLTNLTLTGNGTRSFAFCNSSNIHIGDLRVGTNGPLLEANDSTVHFYGQILFNNLMINNLDVEYAPMVLHSCHYNFSGDISFINNTMTYAIMIYASIDRNAIITGNIPGNVSFINNTIGTAIYVYAYPDGIENNISGNVLFINNTFIEGSSAIGFIGGTNSITGNIFFVNNTCPQGGNQVYLGYTTWYIPGNVSFIHNNVYHAYSEIQDVEGTAIYSHKSTLFIRGIALFIHNRVVVPMGLNVDASGGAIYVTQSRLIFEESSNISFVDNSASHYGGAISLMDSNLTIYGRVLFERNSAGMEGGAIYSLNSVINMTGRVDFNQNSAQKGGAMAFDGSSSKLRLIEPLTANFAENLAILVGGVIFFKDDANQICFGSINASLQNCFVELSSRVNISLNFDNNTATTGRLFYGGNLGACRLFVGGRYLYGERILDTIARISNVHVNVSDPKENIIANVSSDPIQVCICKGDRMICDRTDIVTVRGKEFPLQAVVVGQGLMKIFPSAVRITLDSGALTSAVQRVQSIKNGCTDISYGLLAENDTAVTLFPDNGACKNFGIARTIVNITFLPCPNGFILSGFECICDKRLQDFNVVCNVNDNSIQRVPTSTRFWMGAVYDNVSNESSYQGLLLHSGCPLDYCVDDPVPITLDNLDIQCNHNHSGTLCGSCREGYSIALGTLHCLPNCSNDHLALILPFALSGIALVAVLLLLRLTVSAGTINGLIFYANIIQENPSMFFPMGTTNILTVFIAWLNLDLGIETCFYDGMTTYAYTWLQFVLPFYVWFLIGLIIVVTHYSRRLTKVFGKNPVAALATLFLLSYSKILGTIVAAVSSTELEYPLNQSRIIWLYDGTVEYAQTEGVNHLVLIIFAILVLVFLFVPYTLLLFFAHWLQALSHWRILSWLNKIKPFIDTYHAPYKKQTRYWTGLLLFIRLFLLAFEAISSKLIPVVITSITVMLTSLAWIHKGIYENNLNNILEAFFITNLCMLTASTYYVQTNGLSKAGTAYLFVGLTFAAFIGIILFHVYLVLCETAVWKKIISKPIVKKYIVHKKDGNKDHPPSDSREQSFILQAPTQSTIELHEPLLDQ